MERSPAVPRQNPASGYDHKADFFTSRGATHACISNLSACRFQDTLKRGTISVRKVLAGQHVMLQQIQYCTPAYSTQCTDVRIFPRLHH